MIGAQTLDGRSLKTALRGDGFVHLEEAALEVAEISRRCLDFFLRPPVEKLRFAYGFGGYVPYGHEHSGEADRPDMFESYTLTTDRPWEETPPQFGEMRAAMFEPSVAVCDALCRAVFAELSEPGEETAPEFEYWMQINHFPPTSTLPVTAKDGMRMGAHFDPGFITLFPAGASEAFQYCDREGGWREPGRRGHMAVFSGELFERLTLGDTAGCLHRVRLPDDPNAHRISWALTSTPKREAILRPFRGYWPNSDPQETFTGREYMQAYLEGVMVGDQYRSY